VGPAVRAAVGRFGADALEVGLIDGGGEEPAADV